MGVHIGENAENSAVPKYFDSQRYGVRFIYRPIAELRPQTDGQILDLRIIQRACKIAYRFAQRGPRVNKQFPISEMRADYYHATAFGFDPFVFGERFRIDAKFDKTGERRSRLENWIRSPSTREIANVPRRSFSRSTMFFGKAMR